MTLNPCPYYRKPTAPMESVSWPEANAFAQWLTVTERKLGQITAHQVYRLPTDHEWSCAVGIGRLEDPALPPVNKAGRHRELFPWGKTWPPPAGSGNYASTELDLPNYTHPILEGYSDGFRYMAPVGSYAPNAFGLYDLGGNVAEWCQDLFDVGGPEMRVVRGGCFHSYKDTQICSSARSGLQPGTRHWETGFRVVLAPVNGP